MQHKNKGSITLGYHLGSILTATTNMSEFRAKTVVVVRCLWSIDTGLNCGGNQHLCRYFKGPPLFEWVSPRIADNWGVV